MKRVLRLSMLSVVVSVLLAAASLGLAQAVTITGISETSINVGSFSTAGELSGITYAGAVFGSTDTFRYYAVSDNASGEGATPRVFGLDVRLDMNTGAVTSANVVSQINLSTGYDLEGIAYNWSTGTLYVSDENGSSSKIREYSLSTGQVIRELTVPAVFANGRDNKGFESLSRQLNGRSLWTANEEALSVDGDVSSKDAGTTVRLQKYDAGLNSAGQWAYRTDSVESSWPVLSSQYEMCGVCDLVALPDGTLLVLERELDIEGFGTLDFRNTIYQVDFSSADNVSGISSLTGATYKAVSKTQLWRGKFNSNYEAVCLCPQLNDGNWSMLMVADGGTGSNQPLYALKATGIKNPVPEPASVVSLGLGAVPLFLRRKK